MTYDPILISQSLYGQWPTIYTILGWVRGAFRSIDCEGPSPPSPASPVLLAIAFCLHTCKPKANVFRESMMARAMALEDTLTAVLALNDRGVELVSKGDVQTACIVFRNALQRLRNAVEQQDGRLEPVSTTVWTLQSIVPAAATSQEDAQYPWASFDQSFTICVPAQVGHFPRQNHELIVATILYNMALSYDLRGRQNVRNQLGFIQRACGLYEQAMAALETISAQNEDYRLLVLASANNRAVLALEMEDYDTFEAYRNFLEQFIRPSDVFDYNFFACNVLTTASIHERHTPAA